MFICVRCEHHVTTLDFHKEAGNLRTQAATQSIGTLPQCMANRWRFPRPIRSSVSGVTNIGWFLRGGVPSP